MDQVTISPVDATGKSYRIVLEKTGPDQGFIRIGVVGAPSVTVIKLYDLRARNAHEVVCRGDVFGPDPIIACRLVAEQDDRTLQVEIRGSLFGSYDGLHTYRVTKAEFDHTEDFLQRAAFPSV
ncbi:hypothetical protein ABLE93_24620 [Xanthobacter sp. KR7-65]|uniref:hypothetical protein n=1 Tax=Xanthobacter sp. KR7-65 TaxID=3156612 RepID=UPI0032B36DFF